MYRSVVSLCLCQRVYLSVCICVGSPFQFTVGPITDGGAHKVRAVGPGLERGEVNKPCMYR